MVSRQHQWSDRRSGLEADFALILRIGGPRRARIFLTRNSFFHTEDRPCQLWSCHLSKPVDGRDRIAEADCNGGEHSQGGGKAQREYNESVKNGLKLWLLWNGNEVWSYKEGDQERAYIDLINARKDRRFGAIVRYWTSPLTVSALLALILFLLIFILELSRFPVPSELWSIFTAVVAFYFGRESAGHSGGGTPSEGLVE
jgi:hypothetical protein